MATLKQEWGIEGAHALLGVELDSLADGGYTTGETAVDLGSPAPFGLVVETKLAGSSASNTGNIELYALWSQDNIDFSTQSANARNGELVGVVDMDGVSTVGKVFQIPARARYVKLRAYNDSGAALAADAGDIVATEVAVNSA